MCMSASSVQSTGSSDTSTGEPHRIGDPRAPLRPRAAAEPRSSSSPSLWTPIDPPWPSTIVFAIERFRGSPSSDARKKRSNKRLASSSAIPVSRTHTGGVRRRPRRRLPRELPRRWRVSITSRRVARRQGVPPASHPSAPRLDLARRPGSAAARRRGRSRPRCRRCVARPAGARHEEQVFDEPVQALRVPLGNQEVVATILARRRLRRPESRARDSP